MNEKYTLPRCLFITMLTLFFFVITGCSKVNKENYDKLKVGMSYEEVTQLLGQPEQCQTVVVVKNCTWGKAPKTITVQLVADKVGLFESSGL
ncbi:MAG: DUF3862 domain-containing protein [Methylococcaceae bacterium]|nr:DUF3862 domain-containing protein [Methylococcaceae bacterium]